MHRFTTFIGFGGLEIDRLVADFTIELGLSGLCHNDTSEAIIPPMLAETSVEKLFNFGQGRSWDCGVKRPRWVCYDSQPRGTK